MTLIICEKNNAARRISEILSSGSTTVLKKYNRPYYTYTRDGKSYEVIGLRGHIVALDFPSEYNNWKGVEPRELIFVEPETVNRELSIIKALKSLSKQHDDVIIATDFDREGELIGSEALDIIKKANPDITFRRVHFSSLTKGEITEAFTKLMDMDLNLAASARTRQYLDLVWGASLTRFISISSDRLGYDFLSIGRVQTPTLTLLVDREKKVEAFNPEKYWLIQAELNHGSTFIVKHKKGKFQDREEAEGILRKVGTAKKTKLVKSNAKKSIQHPPPPFNTTSFLRDGTKLGLTASRVMSVAEGLYTRGYISYPRTDNTVYPKTLDLRDLLTMFGNHPVYGEFSSEILSRGRLHPTRGKKLATDHPPIHPTSSPGANELKGDEKKIFDLVARRFFATLGENCIVMNGTMEFDISEEIFRAKSLEIINPGWRKYYILNGIKPKSLPDIKIGEMVDVVKVYTQEKETKPPGRFTQGSLISEMDKLGLGTKSTRHEIIKKLIDREFINTSPLAPTESGKAVIEAMENYSEPITRPDMTKKLETDMDLIADGKMDPSDVTKESQEMLADIFKVLEENRTKIGDSIKKALLDQKVIGQCPRCGDTLIIRQSRRGKRYVSCNSYPRCRNTYPLPQRGRVVVLHETCPVCQSPKIKVLTKGKKPWIICINMGCKHNETNK